MFTENAGQAWRERFDENAPEGAWPLAPLLRRRSIRAFEDRPVSEDLIRGLIGCAQSAATSSNLQMWSVVSVQDPDRRQALNELCSSQSQIATAPWFFAFFADAHRIRRASELAGDDPTALDTTEMMMVAMIDAALAAERMSCAADLVGLGSCYIGALRNHADKVNKLLGLPSETVGVFGLCVGWPEEGAKIKPRLRASEVWSREQYQEPDFTEYAQRMQAFYEQEGMNPGVTWMQRTARRCQDASIGGRIALRGFLDRQGLGRR